MSAPVDVLAVLDAFASYAEKTGAPDRHAPMLREARAAVAELIEAAEWANVALHDYPCEARDKLRAALARIGGAV